MINIKVMVSIMGRKAHLYAQASFYYVARFTQIQLFITLISLPILLAWGLPISLLSHAGNLFFSPLLILFLFFSSLIFFSELLNIPNNWLIYALERLVDCWSWLLNYGSDYALLGLVCPPWWLLITIPALTIGIMLYKKTAGLRVNILCLSLLLLAFTSYLHFIATPTTYHEKIPYARGHITLLHHHRKTIIIDPGYLAQRASTSSWLEYTLLPHLVKTTGATTIHHLILLQPTARAFEAAITLCNLVPIETIHCVVWEGKLPGKAHYTWHRLKEAATQSGARIVRFGTQEHLISLNIPDTQQQLLLTITPTAQKIITGNGSYNTQEIVLPNYCCSPTIISAKAATMSTKKKIA